MTAALTIRPATLADEASALDLLEELFAPPGRRPPDYTRQRAQANFRRYLDSPDGDILLAEQDDTDGMDRDLLGLASVYVDLPSLRFGQRCWLEDLVVASASRGQGIGPRLLDAATDWARERGCTHLELDSGNARTDAHRFYLAQGMAQDGLVFTRNIPP